MVIFEGCDRPTLGFGILTYDLALVRSSVDCSQLTADLLPKAIRSCVGKFIHCARYLPQNLTIQTEETLRGELLAGVVNGAIPMTNSAVGHGRGFLRSQSYRLFQSSKYGTQS